MVLLSIRNLVVDFGGGTPAVANVSLDVAEGEIVALLGPSGCGKTTTMRAIAGLVQVTAGQITLAGRDITHVPANTRGVGLVFQSYALFPHLSVADNIAFGLQVRRVAPDVLRDRVRAMVAMAGLGGLEARLPKELSGGQQQRVALARAVATEPNLLLLDEPLSNLDARLRLDMRAELARIQRTSGVTMLHVTHDQTEALALANRIAVMSLGRIEQIGPPEEIWSKPRTAFVARFMGFETVLLVRAGQIGSDVGTLGPIAARDGACLAWRPQSVVIGNGPFEGVVESVSFLGETVQIVVRTPAGAIKADMAADAPRPPPGAHLAFDLPLATAVEVQP
jgi:putative spermidine/putrescine transport system ATP-binding protein